LQGAIGKWARLEVLAEARGGNRQCRFCREKCRICVCGVPRSGSNRHSPGSATRRRRGHSEPTGAYLQPPARTAFRAVAGRVHGNPSGSRGPAHGCCVTRSRPPTRTVPAAHRYTRCFSGTATTALCRGGDVSRRNAKRNSLDQKTTAGCILEAAGRPKSEVRFWKAEMKGLHEDGVKLNVWPVNCI
jgi:hypothetical protein